MPYEPSPIQTLFLLRLVSSQGGEWLKTVRPQLEKSQRDPLVRLGLIEEVKRKQENGRSATFVALTDRGWNWCGKHLSANLPARSTTAVETFQRFLAKLDAFLAANDFSLAQFFQSTPPVAEIESHARETNANLERRIEQTYASLSKNCPHTRVRLAELRAALPEIPSDDLDQKLLEMDREQKLSLAPLTDPTQVTEEDQAAVLRTPSGEVRHIVYMGGPAS